MAPSLYYMCAMHTGETFLYETAGVSLSFPTKPRLINLYICLALFLCVPTTWQLISLFVLIISGLVRWDEDISFDVRTTQARAYKHRGRFFSSVGAPSMWRTWITEIRVAAFNVKVPELGIKSEVELGFLSCIPTWGWRYSGWGSSVIQNLSEALGHEMRDSPCLLFLLLRTTTCQLPLLQNG